MQIYWNKRKSLHKKRVQLPQDWFGTPTWPPFHCFGTPIWPHLTSCENTLQNFFSLYLVILLYFCDFEPTIWNPTSDKLLLMESRKFQSITNLDVFKVKIEQHFIKGIFGKLSFRYLTL